MVELELISGLTRELASEQSVESVARRGLLHLLRAAGVGSGAVFLHDESRGELRLVASHGLPLCLLRELNRQKLTPAVAAHLDLVALCGGDELSARRLAATATIPLALVDRLLGVVILFAPAGSDLSLIGGGEFRVLGDILAVVLDKTLLAAERDRCLQASHQIRLKADQTAALLRISRRLTESLKLEAVLTSVLEEATLFLNATAGALHLRRGDRISLAATWGAEEALRSAADLAERAINLGETVMGHVETRAFLTVPLVPRANCIGALTCLREGLYGFSEEDRAFLRTLAAHAAMAIENARLHEEAEEQSVRDALTGLYNVRRLQLRLAEELRRAERYRRELSFLMLDIDHFKRYNDTYGHLQGDRVLRRVADVVTQNVRTVDQVFRYGGEEICVLLPETPRLKAMLVAERIRIAVAACSFSGEDGQDLGRVTVSVGVASFPHDAATPQELIARADAALYRAKAQGRNQVAAAAAGEPGPIQASTVTTSSSGLLGR
ncbi:MAG: diguanylate cyclase [Bacillota bacterium]|nr:diguanylate cyclase [Bacillota bacterium]